MNFSFKDCILGLGVLWLNMANAQMCEGDHDILSHNAEFNMRVTCQPGDPDTYLGFNFANNAGPYSNLYAGGWCVDIDRAIYCNHDFQVDSYSSYEPIRPGAVDKPENLDLVNWLINNHPIESNVNISDCYSGILGYEEYQEAVWTLVDHTDALDLQAEDCIVNWLVEQAEANGEGYQLSCDSPGAKIGVILIVDADDGTITNQVLFAEIPIADIDGVCECTPDPTPATPEPTPEPTPRPIPEPTPGPTQEPTPEPTPAPTPEPTPAPTAERMPEPTTSAISTSPRPTSAPSGSPATPFVTTSSPTPEPTPGNTQRPTPGPTPESTTHDGGASGDPHFKTWAGEHYDYHGICDLVLLENHDFQDDLGMDIHIRTKKINHWSYISNAVLRIGDDTLEVMGSKVGSRYWINGLEGEEKTMADNSILAATLSGYPITFERVNKKQQAFSVHIGDEEIIVLKAWNDMVRVDILGATAENFGKSRGLMGKFDTGEHMARDNVTELKNLNAFGQEWQVQRTEGKLFFQLLEGPQAPQQCGTPSSLEVRRRLREAHITQEQAEAACSRVSSSMDRELCIFDVMATDDINLAGAY